MQPERRRQIEDLFQAALQHAPTLRPAFLNGACEGDAELRCQVETLLRNDQVTGAREVHFSPGSMAGPYRIAERLGAGGMGEVYRAQDTRLSRTVAIKTLRARFTERFQHEARAISALNHPNICTLYDVGSQDGTGYLVMEYVEGRPLEGPLPVAEALRLAVQIASALEAAHEKGILHRDLKPGNILVSKSGVKLLDFGLAKFVSLAIGPEEVTLTASLTGVGQVVGTPAYMSPEQIEGRLVDGRSDLFSFGLVFYEILSGRRAFQATNQNGLMAAILKENPAPLTGIPTAVEHILRKCLEKDPAQRWQTAAELRSALERIAVGEPAPQRYVFLPWTIAAAAVLLLCLGAGYWYLHRTPKLTDKDTIILADFTNTTGDPVFDGTLRQGLAVALAQSPFLSLLSDERIQTTLGLMGQQADARLTPKLAREICERAGGAAVLEGSVASLGTQYVLGLRATNCRTGDVLDQEQVQAAKKEDVLNALSQIGSQFRTRVGESLATVQMHSTPLPEATTPSIEALKAYSAGWKVLTTGGNLGAAVPPLKRAIEIDPKFAMAYSAMGAVYGFLSEYELSAESNRKAYELRERASDAEKFFITANYYLWVTGDLEKAQETCEQWAQTYPRDSLPFGFLGSLVYPTFGKYDKAIEIDKKLVEFQPDFAIAYLQLAFNYSFLNQLEETEKVFKKAADRKLDIPDLLLLRYDIAFLKGDKSWMEREVALAQKTPGAEDWIHLREGYVRAYSGHLQEARKQSGQASEKALQANQSGRAALFEIPPALWEAFFGNASAARQSAMSGLRISKDRDVEYGAGFALALSGESKISQTLASDLETRFPEDTSAKLTYVPSIRALLALNRGEPLKAIELLKVGVPCDLGTPLSGSPAFFGLFYSVYVRGLAFLAAHQGPEAAAEFQNVIDHRAIVVSDPIGALAHLQLGRALALSGDTGKAKAAYQDFLALWKDADPDIPILQLAKAEYAALK